MKPTMKPTMHLLVYVFCGIICISSLAMGYYIHNTYPALSALLYSMGIALGPITVLGIIYQYFLFQEIRTGAKEAFSEGMSKKLDELKKVTDFYSHLNDLGIIKVDSSRENAFNEVEGWLRAEDKEIFFVGTSLRGLIGVNDGSEKILEIIAEKVRTEVSLKFLLIHPVFAPLRERYEKKRRRPENSVAREILDVIHTLREMGVQSKNIKFFLGTPTCFGIKTSKYMLLNPYPYQEPSLRTFCITVSKETGNGEIYNAFEMNHFNDIWESTNVVDLEGFDEMSLQKIFNTDINKLLGDDLVIKGLPDCLSK